MPVREKKPLVWFKTSPQVRHSLPVVQEMAESLKQHGQLQDVAALEDGTLIYGHRRLAGASGAGLTELWVQVYGPISRAEIRIIQLVENVQRVDLSPYELAEGVRSLVEAMEQKAVAARLGKSPAWVSRMMSVWKAVPAVQEAFQAGRIGITEVEAISKISPEEQHAMLAAKFGGATRDELVRRARRREEGVKVSRIRFPLASGVTITLVGHGLALDLAIDSLMEGAKAMRKGKADGLDAKTFQAVMESKAKGD